MWAIILFAVALAQPAIQDHVDPHEHSQNASGHHAPAQNPPAVSAGNPRAPRQNVGANKVSQNAKGLSPGELGSIVIGALQAGILAWQISYLGRTLTHDRRSTERAQRAYVNVSSARVLHGSAHVSISNSGVTPAYGAVACYAAEIRTGENVQPLGEGDLDAAKFILAPNSDAYDIEVPSEKWKGDRAQLGHNAKLYVHGRITYVDIFKRPRWITYRYVHDNGEHGFFRPCAQGNRTSEDEGEHD